MDVTVAPQKQNLNPRGPWTVAHSLFGYFNRAEHTWNQKETILSGMVINILFLIFRASNEQGPLGLVKVNHSS